MLICTYKPEQDKEGPSNHLNRDTRNRVRVRNTISRKRITSQNYPKSGVVERTA